LAEPPVPAAVEVADMPAVIATAGIPALCLEASTVGPDGVAEPVCDAESGDAGSVFLQEAVVPQSRTNTSGIATRMGAA
jgi:hypothetical protein